MEHLSEFVVNHWILVTAFFVVAGLLLANLMSGAGGVGPHAAVQLINRDGAIAIDVRSKSDFDAGHIIDALHLPAAELPGSLDKLKKHKDKPLILYCGTGTVSGQTARKLKAEGYTNTHVLKGGISAWRTENLPVSAS